MLDEKQVLEAIFRLTKSNIDTPCTPQELLSEACAVIKQNNAESLPDNRIIEMLCRSLNALRRESFIRITRGGQPVDSLPLDFNNFYSWLFSILPLGMRKCATGSVGNDRIEMRAVEVKCNK